MQSIQHQHVTVVADLWQELGFARGLAVQRLVIEPMQFSRPWRHSLGAIGLMVLLHLLLGIGMLVRFGGVKSEFSDANGQDAQSSVGIITTLILINDSEMPVHEAAWQPANEAAAEHEELIEPPAPATNEGEAEVTSDATGTGSEPRTLQEIYLGQIKARVERAWSDSQGLRLAVGTCKVNIRQGKQGEVQDVQFDDCLATEAWKTTLAQAIRYASPLPAPPDATVFSDEISLEF